MQAHTSSSVAPVILLCNRKQQAKNMFICLCITRSRYLWPHTMHQFPSNRAPIHLNATLRDEFEQQWQETERAGWIQLISHDTTPAHPWWHMHLQCHGKYPHCYGLKLKKTKFSSFFSDHTTESCLPPSRRHGPHNFFCRFPCNCICTDIHTVPRHISRLALFPANLVPPPPSQGRYFPLVLGDALYYFGGRAWEKLGLAVSLFFLASCFISEGNLL